MAKKILSVAGILLILCVFNSCSSNPEKTLLQKYFQALSLKDLTTLSTMAIAPIDVDVESWEIVNVGEEVIEPATLPDLSSREAELKKNVEDSVGITIEARDIWDDAVYEEKNARTRAARRAAKNKSDELKIKYDEILEGHRNIQKDYNDAKTAASREEQISIFSLGYKAGDLPTVRDFTGDVHMKDVEIQIKSKTATNNYMIHLRLYMLKNDATNQQFRGRWVIIYFKTI